MQCNRLTTASSFPPPSASFESNLENCDEKMKTLGNWKNSICSQLWITMNAKRTRYQNPTHCWIHLGANSWAEPTIRADYSEVACRWAGADGESSAGAKFEPIWFFRSSNDALRQRLHNAIGISSAQTFPADTLRRWPNTRPNCWHSSALWWFVDALRHRQSKWMLWRTDKSAWIPPANCLSSTLGQRLNAAHRFVWNETSEISIEFRRLWCEEKRPLTWNSWDNQSSKSIEWFCPVPFRPPIFRWCHSRTEKSSSSSRVFGSRASHQLCMVAIVRSEKYSVCSPVPLRHRRRRHGALFAGLYHCASNTNTKITLKKKIICCGFDWISYYAAILWRCCDFFRFSRFFRWTRFPRHEMCENFGLLQQIIESFFLVDLLRFIECFIQFGLFGLLFLTKNRKMQLFVDSIVIASFQKHRNLLCCAIFTVMSLMLCAILFSLFSSTNDAIYFILIWSIENHSPKFSHQILNLINNYNDAMRMALAYATLEHNEFMDFTLQSLTIVVESKQKQQQQYASQKKNNMVVTVYDTVARQNRAHAQHATCQKWVSSTKLSAILKSINRRCSLTQLFQFSPRLLTKQLCFFKADQIFIDKTKRKNNRVCVSGNGKNCKWIPDMNLSIQSCVSIEKCSFIPINLFFIRLTTQTVTTHNHKSASADIFSVVIFLQRLIDCWDVGRSIKAHREAYLCCHSC